MENTVPKRSKPIDRWLGLVGIAAGIVFYLLPKSLPIVVSSVAILFCLLIHPVWNFWWVEVRLWRKLAATALFVGGLVWLAQRSLPPGSADPLQVAAAKIVSLWRWTTGPHGRWFDEAIGALYALFAVFLLLVLAAAVQIARTRGRRAESQKGFLDYKLDTETAMSRMRPLLERLTAIMSEVGPALEGHTRTLLRAGSTAEQVRAARAAAASLDGYSKRVNRVSGEFVKNGRLLSEGFTGWSAWIKQTRPAKANLGVFPELLRQFTATISTSNGQLGTYIASARAMKGASNAMNAAIDRHVECWEVIAQTNGRIFEACRSTLVILDELA